MPESTYKHWLYHVLMEASMAKEDYKSDSQIFDYFMQFLILLNLVSYTLSTVEYIEKGYGFYLGIFEGFSIAVFAIEYFLRIWCITENNEYKGTLRGRLRYMFTPMALVDLFAFLPAMITYFDNFRDLENMVSYDFRFFLAFRLFSLFRLLKLWRYSGSLRTLTRIILSKKEDLQIVIFTIIILLLVSASLMHLLEKDAQPDKFASIPESLWWAAVTLTTVGYGDVFPHTDGGKILASFVAFLGVCLIALPSGIISAGFIQEFETQKTDKILIENVDRLVRAFKSKNKDTIAGNPMIRRFIDVMTATSQLELSEQAIFEAVKSRKAGLRVRFKKNDVNARFANILAIEYFDLNTKYGTCFNRGSNLTILAPMSYTDHSAGHFSSHVAKYLGANFISNELFGEDDSLNYEAACCFAYNKAYTHQDIENEGLVPRAFLDFKKDIQDIVSSNSIVLIIRTNTSNTGDFHFSFEGILNGRSSESATTFSNLDMLNNFYIYFKNNVHKEGLYYNYAVSQQFEKPDLQDLSQYIWQVKKANIFSVSIQADVLELTDNHTYFKLIDVLGSAIKKNLI